MNDRELLELAAKAAGFTWWRSKHGHIKLVLPGGESLDCCQNWSAYGPYTGEKLPTPEFADALIEHCWNPLTDDADALRLAVKLRLTVKHEDPDASCAGIAFAQPGAPTLDGLGPWFRKEWHRDSDPYAATRRAITRAAAEIGKAQP